MSIYWGWLGISRSVAGHLQWVINITLPFRRMIKLSSYVSREILPLVFVKRKDEGWNFHTLRSIGVCWRGRKTGLYWIHWRKMIADRT